MRRRARSRSSRGTASACSRIHCCAARWGARSRSRRRAGCTTWISTGCSPTCAPPSHARPSRAHGARARPVHSAPMVNAASGSAARRVLGLALALAAGAACVSKSGALARSGPLPPDVAARVDAIFEEWDRPDSPGCALAVIRDGEVVYARGYGMANLEYGIPIAPDTVFDIGSTSKQFTAACVVLLELDGKLSLDDDVRKWIPELPDLGAPITLRHLLHQPSGIRD